VLDVRDLGERVVVAYVIQGRARASGLVFDGGQELAQVATLRDGMITSMRDYFNRREALEAVGLP
jgi:ketosteroid isomerase-like protein